MYESKNTSNEPCQEFDFLCNIVIDWKDYVYDSSFVGAMLDLKY